MYGWMDSPSSSSCNSPWFGTESSTTSLKLPRCDWFVLVCFGVFWGRGVGVWSLGQGGFPFDSVSLVFFCGSFYMCTCCSFFSFVCSHLGENIVLTYYRNVLFYRLFLFLVVLETISGCWKNTVNIHLNR